MNQIYGFEGEVRSKLSDTFVEFFALVFCFLPLAHVINGKIFVVHGGLFSIDGVKLSDIRAIDRFCEPPEEGKSALDAYEIEHLLENSIFDSHVRLRLEIFLQSFDLYDPEEVLDLIEDYSLPEALVLQILAIKLEDCEKYCANVGRPDAYMK
ncbi:PREDICTED: uncharacterized protein LOC109184323 [Ipomoea nil]|uniref:uncharacterized protein LOC109184323 n=1 Tax=Ipomoea nil TaxID=35883 RepID=UPI0009011EC7|nr:PREDICTED: uncharacterized protein LOC109184323 [Ipomoea nil]